MLTNPTLQHLTSLGLGGMADTYEQQLRTPIAQSLTFDERFGLIVDGERSARENRRTQRLLKQARLKAATASAEDINFSARRGLDRGLISSLLTCDWITRGQNVAITGATGTGKTWLGSALGREAARKGMSVLYARVPRLLEELAVAHVDGRLPEMRTKLARPRLLILDDWGAAPVTPLGRQDIFEIMEDRYPSASVLITSQLPTGAWHEYLGEPTVADATLDRILHNCHILELKGESLRRRPAVTEEG